MSEIIDFKKTIGNCKFMQKCNFCKYICAHVLTDMSIIISNCQHCDEQQFQNTVMCTLQKFPQLSRVSFIYTCTVTGSDSCSGKNYAYASGTSCLYKENWQF